MSGARRNMKKKITWKLIKEVFAAALKGFGRHKLPKLSGSLAYYTVFSFAPLLIVIIYTSSLIFGQVAVESKVYEVMAGFLGMDTAATLREIISNANVQGKNNIAIIIGIVTLFIAATTIFAEIQDSINTIWDLKAKPRQKLLTYLKNRFISFSVLVSLGFVLVTSLTVSAAIDMISKKWFSGYEGFIGVLVFIINQLLSFGIIASIIAVIFKVLPDAQIKWKDAYVGAAFTTLLFILGKTAISFYISSSSIGTTYGAAGSLVIIIVWAYYSSLILYAGAELTTAWADKTGSPIRPSEYAVTTKTVELETTGNRNK